MKRSVYTLEALLDEMKSTTPSFKVGQLFETLKPIYPDVRVPRSKKNITYKGISFTKPLASNRKAKERFLKEESPIADFYRNTSKGDFLQVKKVENKKAYCVNVSLKESFRKKYYEDEYIILDYMMIVDGTIKPFKRKNIEKYFNE